MHLRYDSKFPSNSLKAISKIGLLKVRRKHYQQHIISKLARLAMPKDKVKINVKDRLDENVLDLSLSGNCSQNIWKNFCNICFDLIWLF